MRKSHQNYEYYIKKKIINSDLSRSMTSNFMVCLYYACHCRWINVSLSLFGNHSVFCVRIVRCTINAFTISFYSAVSLSLIAVLCNWKPQKRSKSINSLNIVLCKIFSQWWFNFSMSLYLAFIAKASLKLADNRPCKPTTFIDTFEFPLEIYCHKCF